MGKLPISAKVLVTGQTAEPLVNAIVDLFSPVVEPMGWLGDVLRERRLRSAIACFTRAKALAAKEGLKLKAPPAKFLSQYIDNCSLEEVDDKELIDWWARLLLDAGTRFEGKHIFYANILKQITSTELELLECLIRNSGGPHSLDQAGEAEFVYDFNFDASKLALTDKLIKARLKKTVSSIEDAFGYAGVLVLDIFIDDENSNQYQKIHPDYSEDELASWQMLQSLQLIRMSYHRFSAGTVEYRIRTALITELGAKFYFSCHKSDFRRNICSKSRYKRRHKVTRRSKK